jgi:hypothetical protein
MSSVAPILPGATPSDPYAAYGGYQGYVAAYQAHYGVLPPVAPPSR